MCNLILFSTDCKDDFSAAGSGLFIVEPCDKDNPHEAQQYLQHPHKWQLICRYGGCSCHFRHARAPEPEFSGVEDWFPEDDDDLESTAAFYDFAEGLVGKGHKLDLVDVYDSEPEVSATTQVSFGKVSREEFRFFEGHRFEFRS
jgi:hypothetical protein